MKKIKLKVKVMNPLSQDRKKEIIKEISYFIQDVYYSKNL